MNLARLSLSTGIGAFFSLFLTAAPGGAAVRLPNVFGSDMVLQRDQPIIVWGWADPGEKVTVQLENAKEATQATPKGEWKVTLPGRKAGGPLTMTVLGSNTVRFENILMGEVWLCSGQSNMEMGIGACQNGAEEIAAANYPQIRLLLVQNRWLPQATNNIEGTWKVCSPTNVAEGGWRGFSAAGYYFGRELHRKLGVPIGLIDATWGGTRIESWTAPEGFAAVAALKEISERVQLGDPKTGSHREKMAVLLRDTETWVSDARAAMENGNVAPVMPVFPKELLPPSELQNPTALFNGMIHPLIPFGLRGAIWYQGESNLGEGALYTEKMRALIEGWRKVWKNEEFPFFFVQIAPFNYGGDPERVGDFWEAQYRAQEIPRVGMAVITDIGDLKDIHPVNKQEVGRRLSLWALATTYGLKDVAYRGPTFKGMRTEDSKLRIEFDHTEGGLVSRDGKALTWFEIIDAEEGGFVKADAAIEGNSVVLSSAEVTRPVAMRFAWHMLAEPNLANEAGLPATAFRAGTIPKRDLLALKVPEAKEYKLVYDIDLARLGRQITCETDARAQITQPFDRVAYFLELQRTGGETQYLYVSMDAFTADLGQIGIPTAASKAKFQQAVRNLNVVSNVKGVTGGAGLSGGNIEFWPHNYGAGNGGNVPKASAQVYDFGDEPSDPLDGYGSMQVHNHQSGHTLFAINHWGDGAKADIGIGNAPSGNPDWTFAGNASIYQFKRLRVLVRSKN